MPVLPQPNEVTKEYLENRFPKKIYVDALLTKGDPVCTICLSDLRVGNKVRKLPCEHIFHEECIDLWFMRHPRNPTCATC